MKKGTTRTIAVLSGLFVFAVMLTFTSGISFADTDNVTVNVTVANVTEITVLPENVTWSLITPGFAGGNRTVSIQNTGASNIINLYAYVTTLTNESTRPYQSAAASSYASGGILVFRNSSLSAINSNYSWAGRIEWNWTEKIASTDWSNLPEGGLHVRAEGFIRNTSKQFYWAILNGTIDWSQDNTTGFCNNTGALLAIESDEDNGTFVTRGPVITGITRDAGDSGFSYFRIDRAGHFLQGQCVAVHFNCTKIYIYNYDKRTTPGTNFNSCTQSNYITAGPLTPSATEVVLADAWMPRGVPAGQMANTQWTFVVTGN